MNLSRIRWGVRAVLTLGVAASIAGNVLHAQDNAISKIISAWSPLALLLTIELISKVPVHRRSLAVSRWAATAVIAGIAAWVSYWHMAAVAGRYGETGGAQYMLPLSVDGLVVVASVCLVELSGRIRAAQTEPAVEADAVPVEPGPVDSLSTPPPVERKPQPSSRERVEKAHNRTPAATNEQLAKRLNLSTKTVQRWRPVKPADPPPVNGSVPELEEAVR